MIKSRRHFAADFAQPFQPVIMFRFDRLYPATEVVSHLLAPGFVGRPNSLHPLYHRERSVKIGQAYDFCPRHVRPVQFSLGGEEARPGGINHA